MKKALIVSLGLLTGCTLTPAEKINYSNNILVDLKTTTYSADNKYEREGKGNVVGNYILTVDHIVSKYTLKIRFRFGTIESELQRDKEETTLDGIVLSSVIENREKDIAIFDLRETPELCKKYCNDMTLDDLAEQEEMSVGMDVWWNGSPGLEPNFYRTSKVTRLSPSEEDGTWASNTMCWPGSSGSGQYAFINGQEKIVGFIQFIKYGMCFSRHTDSYKDAILKYEQNHISVKPLD